MESHLLVLNISALFIAVLYYAWRDGYFALQRRKKLRGRVAYMLWTAARKVRKGSEPDIGIMTAG